MKLSYRTPHDENKSKPFGDWSSCGTVCDAQARGLRPPNKYRMGNPKRACLCLQWHCLRGAKMRILCPKGAIWKIPKSRSGVSSGTVCEFWARQYIPPMALHFGP